jgi:hypothetical protein
VADLADRIDIAPRQVVAARIGGVDVYAQVVRTYPTQFVGRVLNNAAGLKAGTIGTFTNTNLRIPATAEVVASRIETQRAFRSSDFYPTLTEIASAPGLDIANRHTSDAGTIPIIDHYLGNVWSVWIAGYGKEDTLGTAYGYAIVAGTEGGTWGEIDLTHLEQIEFHPTRFTLPSWMERDTNWRTRTAWEAIPDLRPDWSSL